MIKKTTVSSLAAETHTRVRCLCRNWTLLSFQMKLLMSTAPRQLQHAADQVDIWLFAYGQSLHLRSPKKTVAKDGQTTSFNLV